MGFDRYGAHDGCGCDTCEEMRKVMNKDQIVHDVSNGATLLATVILFVVCLPVAGPFWVTGGLFRIFAPRQCKVQDTRRRSLLLEEGFE